jgi:hypothetical protein
VVVQEKPIPREDEGVIVPTFLDLLRIDLLRAEFVGMILLPNLLDILDLASKRAVASWLRLQ